MSEIQKIPYPKGWRQDDPTLVQTGIIQFEGDTPGVFIRAEHAAMFASAVNQACQFKIDALTIQTLDALLDLLSDSQLEQK
jgi:hypothetical protein